LQYLYKKNQKITRNTAEQREHAFPLMLVTWVFSISEFRYSFR